MCVVTIVVDKIGFEKINYSKHELQMKQFKFGYIYEKNGFCSVMLWIIFVKS